MAPREGSSRGISAWVPLAMDKPATIKGQEVTVRATARRNDRIVIALGVSTGSAIAWSSECLG